MISICIFLLGGSILALVPVIGMVVEIGRREREAACRAARRLWDGLPPEDRFELGDQLVLGTWNWRDWYVDKPPQGTTAELDRLRVNWEDTI